MKNGMSLPILFSIIPFCLIVISIVDTMGVLSGNNAYPFNSDFFSKYSIYHSKRTYLIFNVILSLVFAFAIYMAFKRKWKLFGIILGVGIFMFFYPIFFNA